MTFTLNAYSGSPTITSAQYSLPAGTDVSAGTVQTAAGFYQAVIDFNAVVSADAFVFEVYEAAINGGTSRLLDSYTISNNQSKPIMLSIGYPLGNAWDMTLRKSSGTNRAIPFSIKKVS